MAARKAKRKPAKSRSKRRARMVRLRLCPQLTRGEVRKLQSRAAADMRSVGRTVALLLIEDLGYRGPGRGRPAGGVSLDDQRRAYDVAVPMTAEQTRKVETRARAEVRSVSSYVALLIVAALDRLRPSRRPRSMDSRFLSEVGDGQTLDLPVNDLLSEHKAAHNRFLLRPEFVSSPERSQVYSISGASHNFNVQGPLSGLR